MNFKTVLNEKAVSTYLLNAHLNINKDVDVNIESASFIVHWSLDIDEREWGIKDISANVVDVSGTVCWYVTNDELNETDIAEIKAAGGVLYNNDNWEGEFHLPADWQSSLTSNIELSNGNACYPTDIEIDFKAKTYIIS